MSGRELISRTARGLFRDLMTDSTLGAIGAAFQDEGFAPNPDSTYDDGSSRRILTQRYLAAVAWSDIAHVERVLRVFERLVHGFDPQYSSKCSSTRCDETVTWSTSRQATSGPSGPGSPCPRLAT